MGYIDRTAKIKDSDISEDTKIYKYVDIKNSVIFPKSIVGDFCRIENSKIGYFAQVYPNGIMYNTQLGDYSYVQKNSSVWHTTIGKFCSISWNVSIGGGEHDFHKVTTHSLLYATAYGFVDKAMYDRFSSPCTIGNDVWIGAGASILRGVKVGDGAVIGAGAVVTKDVEPYSIVVGVPAKKVGQRCEDQIISKMLEIKWWDLPIQVIKDNIELFNQDLTLIVAEKLYDLKQKNIKSGG